MVLYKKTYKIWYKKLVFILLLPKFEIKKQALKVLIPMEFPIYNQSEPWEITRAWEEANTDRQLDKKKVLLTDCKIYQRGQYIVIDLPNGKIGYTEHDGNYCYIIDAIEYMKPEIPARWKTLDCLITFRQAIRECTAQGMGLEYMYQIEEGISLEQYNAFIDEV